MPHRVYISASTQKSNIGVGDYGTEQDRMQFLADRVKYWLETQKGQFNVIRNQAGWTLKQTVDHCNNMACELFIDNHTNAGSSKADGTEVYYNGKGGTDSSSYKIGKILYDRIAPLSPGTDQGCRPDSILYQSGLYVIQHTVPPATLVEHIFHTNQVEVDSYLKHIDDYAKQEAMAVCDYFGIAWVEAAVSSGGIHVVINGVDIDEKMDVKPMIVNGRVVVPIRAIADAFNSEITWNDASKTVTITSKKE